MRAVVLGASGFLGLNLVHALQDSGITPRCTYRGRLPRLALRRTGVPTEHADLDDRESLIRVLRDCEVLFHFGAHYPRLSTDRQATLETGRRQLHNVLDACAIAGVPRLLYASSTATVAPCPTGPSTEAQVFAAAPGFGVYHDLKWRMEQQVLAEERFETAVLCPGACLGPWDLRIGTSALVVGMARGLAPPHPDGWINLVDVRDVGEMTLRLAQRRALPKRVILSGHDFRLHALLEGLAVRYRVPPPPPALSAEDALQLADREEHRCRTSGERPTSSRELVDLIVHACPLDASLATRLTGVPYRPLAETLDAYDHWARSKRILPPPPTEVHAP